MNNHVYEYNNNIFDSSCLAVIDNPSAQVVWQDALYYVRSNAAEFSYEQEQVLPSDTVELNRSFTRVYQRNIFQGWNQQRFNSTIPVPSVAISFENFIQHVSYIGDVLESKQESKYLVRFSEILQEIKKIEMISGSISYDVLAEIEKRGLKNEIYRVLTIAFQEYRNLNAMRVAIKHDPEITERTTISIILTVSGIPEDVLVDEKKYKQKLFSCVKAEACKSITVSYNWKD
jgi:hypothetical protein